MKGYELLQKIAKGEIEKGTKFKDIEDNGLYEWDDLNLIFLNGRENMIYNDRLVSLVYLLHRDFEIVDEKQKWKPKCGEKYWCIESTGNIIFEYWTNSLVGNHRLLHENCFKTDEEVVEYRTKMKYQAIYKEMSDITEADWKDTDKSKWCAFYQYGSNKVKIEAWTIVKYQGIIYFSTEQKLKEAIDKIGEDNFKKYVLEVGV